MVSFGKEALLVLAKLQQELMNAAVVKCDFGRAFSLREQSALLQYSTLNVVYASSFKSFP